MNKLSQLWHKIDESLLSGLLTVFLFLIPLYPKLPLVFITYTYVAIRLDDLFIAAIALVFLVQVLRKKVTLNRHMLKLFLLFWGAVFVSYFIAIALTHTIIYRQVGFLHALRRIEYMFIFFVAMSQIRKSADFTKYLFAIATSTFLVIIYGIGQRIAEFPSVSTMNPEFAKGHILFLTPEARIASTFAGHYDLAAYLVFIIPIMWGLYFVLHEKLTNLIESMFNLPKAVIRITSDFLEKIIHRIVSLTKLSHTFDDPLSQLRQEFEVHRQIINSTLLAGSVSILFLALSIKSFELIIGGTLLISLLTFIAIYKKQSAFAILFLQCGSLFVLIQTASRSSFLAYIVSITLFLLLIKKFRYLAVILFITLLLSYHNKNLSERIGSTFQVRQFLVNEKTGEIFVLQKMRSDVLPAGSRVLVKVDNKKKNTSDEAQVKQEFLKKASKAALLKNAKDASGAAQYTQVQGIAPDISFDTRLRVEWPRAIGAFTKNPLFGTGVSTITESTDNDFLRWLGETGLFGTVTFLYILLTIAHQVFEMAKSAEPKMKPLFFGFLFGLLGLAINALYIDVFEASKVAYMFWATCGLFSGLYFLDQNS